MIPFNNVCSGSPSCPDGYSSRPSSFGRQVQDESVKTEYFVAGLNQGTFACDPKLIFDGRSIYVREDNTHYFFRRGDEEVFINKIDVSRNEDGTFIFEGNIYNSDGEI